MSYGRGGVTMVSRISGVSRTTITAGIKELKSGNIADGRIRKSGGGRKHTEEEYPEIVDRIRSIVDGKTYGDPMRVLSYTTESWRKIAAELLEKHGISVSYVTVGDILGFYGLPQAIESKDASNWRTASR
jgi:hypothetical protein